MLHKFAEKVYAYLEIDSSGRIAIPLRMTCILNFNRARHPEHLRRIYVALEILRGLKVYSPSE